MKVTSTSAVPADAASAADIRLAKHLPPGFLDFKGLLDFVPLGERTTRELIRLGVIPSIRLPNGRRLLFSAEAVEKALLRFQRGGNL